MSEGTGPRRRSVFGNRAADATDTLGHDVGYVGQVGPSGGKVSGTDDTDHEQGAVDPRTLDPEPAGTDNGSTAGNGSGSGSSTRKSRGRKSAASGKARSQGSVKSSAKAAETLLASIHQMLAMYLKMPGLMLSQDEAITLGEAIANVQQFYPDAVFDPKHMAWLALACAVLRVEGPRAVLVAKELRDRKDPNHPQHKSRKAKATG